MDNYFNECPPMMDDGRLFTDYRSSQVREEVYRFKNSVISENETRMLRTNEAETIMDREWKNLRETNSCFTQKRCFHLQPITQVSSIYNNAEVLAYNGLLPALKCDVDCQDYRLTLTKGSTEERSGCIENQQNNYPNERRPEIGHADIVISMLPARFHVEVAKDCIELKTDLIRSIISTSPLLTISIFLSKNESLK